MNNIRGFSYNLPTREASLSHETRNAEAPPQLGNGKNSFENVLTGLSQDSGDADVTAKPSRQSPFWPLLGNEQSAKETGAEPDSLSCEGMLDAAATAAKPIIPAARLGRSDLGIGTTATASAATLASGSDRLAAPSAAASAGTLPFRPNNLQETLEWDDATSRVAAKSVLNEPLGAYLTQASRENTAIEAPNATETHLAGGGPVSPLLQSGARLGNSEIVAAAADSQTGAIGRAGASRRDLFASSVASPAGKAQRSCGAQDASQTPAANSAATTANAALAVVPVAMFDSHSFGTSHSSDAASVQTTAPGDPRTSLLKKGGDRSVESPDETIPPAQISTQSGVAGQGGFGSSFTTKVNVVWSATHFAPVARLSPARQIAGFVMSSLPPLAGGLAGVGEASAVTAPASLDLPLAVAQPSATAVKTLNLQLEPDSLGQVSIRLNLSGGGLDLEVNAERGTTVDLIEKDKQSLSDQIRQSGYSVTGLEVRLAGPAASNLSSDGGGSNQATLGNGQATGGSTRGDGGGAHDSSAHAHNRQNSFGTSPQDTNGGSPDRRSARGDLYV